MLAHSTWWSTGLEWPLQLLSLSVSLSVLCYFFLIICLFVLCHIFSNPTAVCYRAATHELRWSWYWVCAASWFKRTWYFDVNCNVCDADFSLRVKLRRHIRRWPLKLAPATCFIYLLNSIILKEKYWTLL